MLTDNLKAIKELADETFAEVEDSDISNDVWGSLLANLDDIGTLVEDCLILLAE